MISQSHGVAYADISSQELYCYRTDKGRSSDIIKEAVDRGIDVRGRLLSYALPLVLYSGSSVFDDGVVLTIGTKAIDSPILLTEKNPI